MDTELDLLLEDLDKTRKLLNQLRDRINASGVERTVGLKKALGAGCDYYKKSLRLLLAEDYDSLRDLVKTVDNLFTACDQKMGDPNDRGKEK